MNSNQTSVNYGLIGGMAAIALGMLYYLINVRGFIAWGGWFSNLAIIASMAMAALAVRREQGGFLPFREALKSTFLVWVIASFLSMVFLYLLYNFIDPGLVDIQKEVVAEMMDRFLASADQATIDQIEESMTAENFGLDIKKSLLGYAFSLIFPGFIVSLIVAAIVKRPQPNNDLTGA